MYLDLQDLQHQRGTPYALPLEVIGAVQTRLLQSAVVPHKHGRYPSISDGAMIITVETIG